MKPTPINIAASVRAFEQPLQVKWRRIWTFAFAFCQRLCEQNRWQNGATLTKAIADLQKFLWPVNLAAANEHLFKNAGLWKLNGASKTSVKLVTGTF